MSALFTVLETLLSAGVLLGIFFGARAWLYWSQKKVWLQAAKALGVPLLGEAPYFYLEGTKDGVALRLYREKPRSGRFAKSNSGRPLKVVAEVPGAPNVAEQSRLGGFARQMVGMGGVLSGDSDFDAAYEVQGADLEGLAFLSWDVRRTITSLRRHQKNLSWQLGYETLMFTLPFSQAARNERKGNPSDLGISGLGLWAVETAKALTPTSSVAKQLLQNTLNEPHIEVRLRNASALRELAGPDTSHPEAERREAIRLLSQHDGELQQVVLGLIGQRDAPSDHRDRLLRWAASRWPDALVSRLALVREKGWKGDLRGLLTCGDPLTPALREALETTIHAIENNLPIEGAGRVSLVVPDERGALSLATESGGLSLSEDEETAR